MLADQGQLPHTLASMSKGLIDELVVEVDGLIKRVGAEIEAPSLRTTRVYGETARASAHGLSGAARSFTPGAARSLTGEGQLDDDGQT
jgi:hypothetical protein